MNKQAPIAVLSILLFLAGCSARQDNTVQIGAALPLSGPVAYYGQSPQKGISIALDEINGAGGVNGKKLEVVYEDTLGTAQGAVNALRKLLDVNKPSIVIGAGASVETLAIGKLATENKVVLLSPVSSAAEIRDLGEYVFRTVPSDGFQAAMLAKWVVDDEYKRVSLMFLNSSWSTSLKNHFAAEFERLGGQIVAVESADVDATDFRTQLLKLSRPKPQAIIALLYAKEGGRFLKQAHELGIAGPFFGGDPWTIKDFLDIAGPAANGARFTTPAAYEGPEAQAFQKKYAERYGTQPDVYGANGYDALRLVADAIRKGATSGPAFRQIFLAVRNFPGATGTTTFDDHGDVVSKPFARMTIRDGRIVSADR